MGKVLASCDGDCAENPVEFDAFRFVWMFLADTRDLGGIPATVIYTEDRCIPCAIGVFSTENCAWYQPGMFKRCGKGTHQLDNHRGWLPRGSPSLGPRAKQGQSYHACSAGS